MASVFISHSSRDNAFAAEIKAWLADQGYENVFLDFDKTTGLDAGREWERQLYEAISRCHAVLLIITTSWLDSKWCFAEQAQARALGKLIFPLVITPDDRKLIGPTLRTIQTELWNDDGRAHLARRLKEVAEEIARGHRWDRSRPPWPGIMAFEAEDAAVFFGRDPEIRKISEQLEARRVHGGARLVLIVGASGSGKSSVLKAGVLPYLGRDPRSYVALPPFRPGRTPVLAFAKMLAEALGRAGDFQAIRADLTGPDPRAALANAFEALRIGPARDATVLVSVDQFEELFTVAEPKERAAFLQLLAALAATNEEHPLPTLVVGTVRSDLLGEILKAQGFAIAHEVHTLGALPVERLPSVIEGPAEIAAIHLDDGLVARILGDVGAAPEALPLLAFTLRELNERYGGDKKLTLADYEELGDPERKLRPLENAVRRTAEDVLAAAAPTPEEEAALKEAFVAQLVRVNQDGVRLRRPARMDDIPQGARRLIEKLVAARLLSVRTEGEANAIEVAHESLFKAWPKLTAWLDQEQDFLTGRRQIEESERLWATTPPAQKDKALLSGLLLEKAREWSMTHPERLKNVRDFVLASIRAADLELAKARRRQLILTSVAAAAALVFAVLGGVAMLQYFEADAANKTIRVVQRLARHTGDTSARPQRNLLLSVEVARLRASGKAGVSLAAIDAVRQQLHLAGGRPLSGHLKSTRVATFSRSGQWLATGSDDGMVRLWDVSAPEPKSTVLSESGSKIRALAFGPDDGWLFGADEAGVIRSWKIGGSGITPGPTSPAFSAVHAMATDPKGRWLAFATEAGNVCTWKLSDSGFVEAPCWDYGKPVHHLRFSAQGRWLAAAGGHDYAEVALWNLSDGAPPAAPKRFAPTHRLNGEPWLTAMAFSGDESRLAVVYSYHAQVWDLTKENPPSHVLAEGSHGQWITGVDVSPDGRWFATAGSDARVKLWEIGGSPEPIHLEGHTAPVNAIAFSDDGKWLITAGNDTTARLWNLAGTRTIPSLVLRGQDSTIAGARFSPGAAPRHLVTVGDDQHARLWSIANLAADSIALRGHKGADAEKAAAVSADGRWIASAGYDDKQLLVRSIERPSDPVARASLESQAKGIAISRDGRWIAAALHGPRAIYLWRFPELGTAIRLTMGATPGEVSLGFSPDNRWLLAGTDSGGRVNLWDLSAEAPAPPLRHICRHAGSVRGLAFSADGRFALAGSYAQQVRLWDLRAGDPCASPRILRHDVDVTRVAISHDAHWAATAGDYEQKGRLWDLSVSGAPKLEAIVPLSSRGTSTAISADGRWVAFGDWAGRISVIDLQGPKPLKPVVFSGHAGRTNSVAFTPDSKLLVTSGEDRVARLWNPSDPREAPVTLRGHADTVFIVGTSPDSRRLATIDKTGMILVWDLQLPDLVAVACRTAGRQLTATEIRDLLGEGNGELPCLDQPKPSEEARAEE